MVGVMSGAVTNTPGLGAAQQTFIDVASAGGAEAVRASQVASGLASGYAVAYPVGVLGVILVIILFKGIFKIDPEKELADLKAHEDSTGKARRMHVAVENPAIFGKKLHDVLLGFVDDLVVPGVVRHSQVQRSV